VIPVLRVSREQDEWKQPVLRVRFAGAALTADFSLFFDYPLDRKLAPFVRALRGYPLSSRHPPLLQFYSDQSPGLRILVEQVDRRGGLQLRLRVNEDSNEGDLADMIQVTVPVTYGTLQRLADGFERLDSGSDIEFCVELI
jgi:hypothetical protein